MSHNRGEQEKTKEVCLECGSSRLDEEVKEQKLPFGPPDARTMLTASMPVFTCLDCGYEFFDERGELARHEAVCRHLGVQTPEEIRTVREAAGLGRVGFCQIGGFGIASLQRWECGEVVPNASSDRLIYLLRFHDNIDRIRAKNRTDAGPLTEVATPSEQIEHGTGIEMPQALRKRRTNPSYAPHFPALERRGEIAKCRREADRIQKRGYVLAPVA